MAQLVDGYLFEKMIKNGLANIREKEEDINNINVFPVTDGDTGTNMRRTLENGVNHSEGEAELGSYLEALSEGMLLGARGNSGMILSQLFKGVYLELSHNDKATTYELSRAFVKAYETAYDSVVEPVEGTILTVTRLGIENVDVSDKTDISVEKFLGQYVDFMRDVLNDTPSLLPVLEEYNVVDSGGVGYITIIEGMHKSLLGETINGSHKKASESLDVNVDISKEIFNKDSAFDRNYCMEFNLQLLSDEKYQQNFNKNEFIEMLKQYGDSIVVSTDVHHRVKVHVHTFTPSPIMAYAQKFGEFITFKLENMQLQYNQFIRKNPKRKKREHKELAIIAVASGEGMRKIFKDMCCDIIIDGSSKMEVTVHKFHEELNQLDADYVVMLPNSSSLIPIAVEAIDTYCERYKKDDTCPRMEIIKTSSQMEGYYALSMDMPDESVTERIECMRGGASNVLTLIQKPTRKQMLVGDKEYPAGTQITVLDNQVVSTGDNPEEALLNAIKGVDDIDDKEFMIIFRGYYVEKAQEEELEAMLEDAFPDLECEFLYGEQTNSNWIVGII